MCVLDLVRRRIVYPLLIMVASVASPHVLPSSNPVPLRRVEANSMPLFDQATKCARHAARLPRVRSSAPWTIVTEAVSGILIATTVVAACFVVVETFAIRAPMTPAPSSV